LDVTLISLEFTHQSTSPIPLYNCFPADYQQLSLWQLCWTVMRFHVSCYRPVSFWFAHNLSRISGFGFLRVTFILTLLGENN